MKLRKNQTISPKNFFVLPREMKNIHGRNPQRAPKKSKSSRIKVRRVTICRDARLVSSGKASVVSKVTASSLYQLLLRRGFDGDGRTDRASLQMLPIGSLHNTK